MVPGALLVVSEYALSTWVIATNRFAVGSARLQPDRNQTVVDRGPYSVVRHPMCSSILILLVETPLLLGSWWAYIPSGVSAVMYVLRGKQGAQRAPHRRPPRPTV